MQHVIDQTGSAHPEEQASHEPGTPPAPPPPPSRVLQLWSLVGFWGLGIGIAVVAATVPTKSTQSDATARGRTEGTGDAGVQRV